MNKIACRFLLLALFAALGCEEEPIRVQKVAKAPLTETRTLAVILPRDDATWFLKLSGPVDTVTTDESAFRKLAQSLTFPGGDQPIQWKMPEGWTDLGETRERFAGFKTTTRNEATITQLPPSAKDVLANVNRWRGQIALPPVEAGALDSLTKPIAIAGVNSTWVDLVNRGDVVVPLRKSVTETKAVSNSASQLNYVTPPGWQVLPASGMTAASFLIGEKVEQVDVTVVPMAGPAGGIVANINRWRGQIGLAQHSEVQIKAASKELMMDGRPAVYVDLLGPEGDKRQRILAAFMMKNDTTWFLKMRGPADAVARQQAAFETFARSFQPGGGGS